PARRGAKLRKVQRCHLPRWRRRSGPGLMIEPRIGAGSRLGAGGRAGAKRRRGGPEDLGRTDRAAGLPTRSPARSGTLGATTRSPRPFAPLAHVDRHELLVVEARNG